MTGRVFASRLSLRTLAGLAAFLCLCFCLCLCPCVSRGQELAKRLILTDGSYQLATKWEMKGDRVRYFSAERGEWEEVPKSMVDWAATDKYEKDREHGVPLPGAAELDKDLASQEQGEEARRPEVAPGLHLPDEGGVLLLDTFESQPQLVELQQTGSQINPNRKGNIFRASINPLAKDKQTIEIPGRHAQVQAHVAVPAIYVRVESDSTAASRGQSSDPWDRFRIVRLEESKQDKRVVGDIKVAIYGKAKQEQKLVATSAVGLAGGWVKITPSVELTQGEYAVVEMLGDEGINGDVWDFGVNASARANAAVLKPEASGAPARNPAPELKKEP